MRYTSLFIPYFMEHLYVKQPFYLQKYVGYPPFFVL